MSPMAVDKYLQEIEKGKTHQQQQVEVLQSNLP
jgi:hypothetical protein